MQKNNPRAESHDVLLVERCREETRVALLRDGELLELGVERQEDGQRVGAIYLGRVSNVLPGMQAAFVEIGLEKNAFLYAGDCQRDADIRELFTVGQWILVQVVKEPGGNKGVRVTPNITLPGRYSVLAPTQTHIGVSRKIEDESEHERLKGIMTEVLPEGFGAIARTAAAGQDREAIEKDIRNLSELWTDIQARAKRAQPPACVYMDEDILYRAARDMLTDDTERMVVNWKDGYDRLRGILETISPRKRDCVELDETAALFGQWGVESRIEKAIHRKVWLKSGGYLYIDVTEALTVIDVNTGKFVGRTDLQDTVFRTNLEAAQEIARQLRLRDIGGIIVIDFIDMLDEGNRQAVVDALREACKADRSRTNVIGLTSLGLVEMTRRKIRRSLDATLKHTCPVCDGEGRVLTEETMVQRMYRDMDRHFVEQPDAPLLLTAHPAIARALLGRGGAMGKTVFVQGDARLSFGEYRARPLETSQTAGIRLGD